MATRAHSARVFLVLAAMSIAVDHPHRSASSSASAQATDDNGAQKAIDFMKQFGYLENHGGADVETIYSHDAISSALKQVQMYGGIPQTGDLDNKTLKLMTSPRCGVPESTQKKRHKRFAILNGWKKRRITYFIANWTPQLRQDDVRRELRAAFDAWSKYSELKFIEVNSMNADMTISFQTGDHGDGYKFDGPGGILAHAFFPGDSSPEGLAGDMHFDDDEVWKVNMGPNEIGIDLFSVAVHELGHSLGLSHSPEQGAVMNPYYRQYDQNQFKLGYDDMMGLYHLYIANNNLPREDEDDRSANNNPPEAPRPQTTTTTTTTRRPAYHDPRENPRHPQHYDPNENPRHHDPRENPRHPEHHDPRENPRHPEYHDPRENPRHPEHHDPRENPRHPEHHNPRYPEHHDPRENPRRPEPHDPRYPQHHDPRENPRRPEHHDPRENPRHPEYHDPRENPRRPEYQDPRERPGYNDPRENPRRPEYQDPREHPEYHDPKENPRRPEYQDPKHPGHNDPSVKPKSTFIGDDESVETHKKHDPFHTIPDKAKPFYTCNMDTPPSPPDFCAGDFDAITSLRRELFIFKKGFVHRLMDPGRPYDGYPIPIDTFFRKSPGMNCINAAYERPTDSSLIVFSGPMYWVYDGTDFIENSPQPITNYGLPKTIVNIDAAMVWKPNRKTYLFSNEEYWRYDDINRTLDKDYPKKIRPHFRGVPTSPDGAMTWTDGITYFFKQREFWRFNNTWKITEREYPMSATAYWLNCEH